MEPATRDKTRSAQFPSLFCQLRPSGLYLIIRMAPGPPLAREGVRCRHEPLEKGYPSPAARVPDPPRGVRDLHVSPRLPGARACTPSRGFRTAACPAATGARKTLTCRARRMPPLEYALQRQPRRLQELAGHRRDHRGTKDDIQDDRLAGCHAPQCTFYSIRPLYPAIRGETTTSTPPLMCAAPPCDYKRRRRASFRRDAIHHHLHSGIPIRHVQPLF